MKNTLDPGLSTLSKTAIILISTVLLLGMGAAETLNVDPADGSGEYSTIQDAIDAASSGDTIEVSDGTYEEDVKITKSLSLEASGDIPEIVGQGSGKGALAVVDGTSDVYVEGFKIEQTGDEQAVGIEQAGGVSKNITFVDNTIIIANEDGLGIYPEDIEDGVFRENTFETKNDAEAREFFAATGSTNLLIENNDFNGVASRSGQPGGAIELRNTDQTTVRDNDFTDFTSQQNVVVESISGDNTFSGNTYTGNEGELVYAAGNIYSSIQTAIDNAETESTVEVSEGKYSSVDVTKDLTLKSLGEAQNTVIESPDSQGIRIESSGVEVNGFRIESDGSAGIYFASGAENSKAVNNYIVDTGDNPVNGTTNGIRVEEHSATIEDNVIESHQHGVMIAKNFETSDRVMIKDNKFLNNGLDGIYVVGIGSESSGHVIKDNVFKNTVGEHDDGSKIGAAILLGAYTQDISDLEIEHNKFINNSQQNLKAWEVNGDGETKNIIATHNYWGQPSGPEEIDGDIDWRPYFPTEQAYENSNSYTSHQAFQVDQNSEQWAEDTNSERSTSEIRSIAQSVASSVPTMNNAEVRSIVESEVEGFVTESELESELDSREETIEEQEQTIEAQEERIDELESEVESLNDQMNQTLEVLEESGQAEVSSGPTGSFTVTSPEEEGNQGGGIGGFFSGLFG